MNTDQKNKIIIISSPSGAGKTTLCKLLLKKMRNVNLSISYTSRNQRLNEKSGKDYFVVTIRIASRDGKASNHFKRVINAP